MAGRREAREQALQALYQLDMAGSEPDWGRLHGSDDLQAFTRELVDGVRTNRERIDALIAGSAEHWRLPRLSRVDLNESGERDGFPTKRGDRGRHCYQRESRSTYKYHHKPLRINSFGGGIAATSLMLARISRRVARFTGGIRLAMNSVG